MVVIWHVRPSDRRIKLFYLKDKTKKLYDKCSFFVNKNTPVEGLVCFVRVNKHMHTKGGSERIVAQKVIHRQLLDLSQRWYYHIDITPIERTKKGGENMSDSNDKAMARCELDRENEKAGLLLEELDEEEIENDPVRGHLLFK